MKSILVFLIFISLSCNAQVPTIEWQKCFGGSDWDDAVDILPFWNNEFIVLGKTSSSNGDVSGYHPGVCPGGACPDIWVVKIDSVGNLIWQKSVGGSLEEYPKKTVINPSNGLLFLGLTKSNDGDINITHGISDAWLMELNDSGSLIFQKCFGGSNFDGVIQSLVKINNSEAIFCGNTYSNDGDVTGNHGLSDIWLVKIDSTKSVIWQKCIGGSLDDYSADMVLTNAGDLVLLGKSHSSDGNITAFSHGGYDFWVCKLDTAGNILWQKSYGGGADDEGRFIKLTRDGGFIVSGSTNSNNGNVLGNHGSTDFWVIKLDSMGNLQWQKCLGGTAIDDGYGIDTTDDGGYVLGGIVSSDNGDISNSVDMNSDNAWVVKLDSMGNIVWDRSMGGTGTDFIFNLKTMPNESIMLVGGTASNDIDVSGNHGSFDYWVVKLTALPDNISNDLNGLSHLSAYFNSDLYLDFYLSKAEALTFQIFDITGRLLLSKSMMGEQGINKQQFQLADISKGLYFVNVNTTNGSLTKNIVIQ